MSKSHIVIDELMREVLQDAYTELKIKEFRIKESPSYNPELIEQNCEVWLILAKEKDGETLDLSGTGVGFVDAAYQSLMTYFSLEYRSLESIEFISFDARAQIDPDQRAGADAECTVRLIVANHDNDRFSFEETGRSMAAVALKVVVRVVEFFVNSERAFILVYKALTDARNRQRMDLVERFTAQLAGLVKTTSYTQVISQIKEEMGLK